MPSVTPRPQAHAMESWSPIPPATTCATTPQPNRIRMNVPASSAEHSPRRVFALTASVVAIPAGLPSLFQDHRDDHGWLESRSHQRPPQRPPFDIVERDQFATGLRHTVAGESLLARSCAASGWKVNVPHGNLLLTQRPPPLGVAVMPLRRTARHARPRPRFWRRPPVVALALAGLAVGSLTTAAAADTTASRPVMFVGNNWEGTADVLQPSGSFTKIGRVNMVPDKAE